MSIVSEINRINTNIANAYSKCNEKGATMPQVQNSSNLANTIDSISSGGGGLDWSAIGYTEEPSFIQNGYNYAVQLQNNWVAPNTLMEKFKNNYDLVFMPLVDTSNATAGNSAFNSCSHLITIPQLDTSKITVTNAMFYKCVSLREIAELDLSSTVDNRNFLTECQNLEILGGFKDFGKAFSTNANANYVRYVLDLSSHIKLTHDSLMNVINKLYDIKTKGCNNQQLILGATNLAKLTSQEIEIATNKGWNVS